VGVLRRRPPPHHFAQAALAVLTALAAILCAGCGPRTKAARVLPGPGGRLNPLYDATLTYPDSVLIIGGLSYHGLQIDLSLEFGDATLGDDDPVYTAEARVQEVLAGGQPQTFQVEGPLDIQGTLAEGALATGLFGPIRVGTTTLFLELSGTLQDSGRRVAGAAGLYGSSERGSFVAIKRRRYLVAGTDRQGPIGKVAVVSLRDDTRFSLEEDMEVISSDPIARVEDGRPLIVNRLSFDNLQGLDPGGSFRTVFQHSTGNGSNPHDAVILPDGGGAGGGSGLAFTTRYEPPFNDVAVIDLASGALIDRIDLVPYARNPDHLPRADQALLHDGLIYVTLEDANGSFTQFMDGRVVLIDPILRRVVDVIDLPGQNPFEALSYSGETGLIYIGLAGIFRGRLPQALTGGIVTLDPATRQARLLVDDDALGGNVSAVALHSATRGYCVVTDASYRNFVKAFDPTTGEVLGTVFESPSEIAALEADGDGLLLIGENDFFAPRIVVLDAVTGRAVASLPVLLPPFSFAILTRSL
jgi:hypothetical protein